MESKEVTVGKKKLTVHKKTFGMQLRRYTMMEAAQQDPQVEGEGLEAIIRNAFHQVTYPSLVACTVGKAPSEQDCFDAVTNDELEAWLAAARELNPDWFPSNETVEEQEKKE